MVFALLFTGLAVSAQTEGVLTGIVTDAATGDTIYYPSVSYKGQHIAVSGTAKGEYTIVRKEGLVLTFSAVGYAPVQVVVKSSTPKTLNIKLKSDTRQLAEVVVRQKRGKYSRKDNPAVELMRRVIAAKKRTQLENHDFFQYTKYQKITLALNDITPTQIDSGFIGKRRWMLDQVEHCPYNNKLILPVSVDETVTQHIYRKQPKTERDIIKGQSSTGINQLIQTGDIMDIMLKDVFTDVNIYDNDVRLLRHHFTSPIGNSAISFYRYYIEDTVYVGKHLCYHLQFTPNNGQDIGFRGELYVVADSTLHVKRCNLTLPIQSGVNFVQHLQVRQEFTQLENGEWALSEDDMIAELEVNDLLQKAIVIRTTRLNNYAFDELPAKLFKGSGRERREADAMMRDEAFWKKYRAVELSKSESSMDEFVHRVEQMKGFKYIIFGLKALIENFVETGGKNHPSKVDIGPVNTMFTRNFIDGFRTRISAQTTANLSPHWFLAGYVARGWGSKKNYYSGEITYSFNRKEYLPREFPKRTVSFKSTYDIMSPSDKFLRTDKDNVFTAFKWAKVDAMMFYNRQQLTLEREEEWGLKTTLSLRTEENEAAGSLFFEKLSSFFPPIIYPETDVSSLLHNGKIRTTELRFELEIAPGRTFINTKQRRIAINLEAPVITLSHAVGLNGVLGGQYRYNFSEVGLLKRFWLRSWGKFDVQLRAGAQWDKVPFPLLIMPAANLSYIVQKGSFNLINNMEFLNDRYASVDLAWDMNGKIFNRIPLLKKLKWREYIGFKGLWGSLTDKNNPFLFQNMGDATLMYFPEGSHVMNPKRPYMELIVGVHNIFKLFHVQYVRRLNYNELPTAHKQGVRLMMRMSF
jgi:putative outer membrane protein